MEWISVEDQLPEEYLGVLCYQPIENSDLWIVVVGVRQAGMFKTLDYFTDDVIHELEPTHWMPLPPPAESSATQPISTPI